LGMVVHTCNPSYLGGQDRRIAVWDWSKKNTKPYLKNELKEKRTRAKVQMVEHLPRKCEALNLTPNTKSLQSDHVKSRLRHNGRLFSPIYFQFNNNLCIKCEILLISK
jgi:hypothetical protein